MPRSRRFQISLANKCRILFSLAVLLILASALYVPWIRMDDLYKELNRQELEITAARTLAQFDANPEEFSPTVEGVEYIDLRNIPGAARVYADRFLRRAVAQMRGPSRRYDAFRVQEVQGKMRCRYVLAVRELVGNQRTGKVIGVISVTAPLKNPHIQFWNHAVILAAGGLASVLAVLVFYLITQTLILSPVRHLRRAAEQVSEGDLHVRSNITTHDEFEDLSDAFNNMLENLNRSHEELQKINKSLDVKLGELAETNVALYEANRLKSSFIANVTHELRTPMASIIGFAELLQDAGEDKEGRIRRYANNILTSGRMLLDLINDLLDLAKIEAGRTDLHRSNFELRAVCEELMDFFQPVADKKNIGLSLGVEGEWPQMDSDAGKIKQILYNLISNALKFTPQDGRVGIEVRPGADDDFVELRVWDTGPGIPVDQRVQVFEPFMQIDASVTREHGGTGLGLTISRELARALGGRLDLSDEPPRSETGAEFVVVLPVRCPDRVEPVRVRLN